MLIDTHSHIYLQDFAEDRVAMLKRAQQAEVTTIHLPAIDSNTHAQQMQLVKENISHVRLRPMMGVHPCSIKENYEDEMAIAKAQLDSGISFSAIGEIGLDFYWDISWKAQQIAAFETQLQWAVERELPVVIHSRKSTYDCIATVKKYAGKLRGIFHCFSGSLEEANEILKLDFLLGIGGVVTYKAASLRQVLTKVPLQNIVLETDAPYLSPVPFRGKRNEPANLRLVCETVANIKQVSFAEVARVTTANALALLGE